ncbi:MAG: DUF6378 domain-containing protein [Pseudohongiellaceae bacterium]
MTTERTRVLQEADTLINGQRQEDYGTPRQNFGVIADMWAAYLGADIEPRDVANMMALLKIARLRMTNARDSAVDGAGYLALGYEIGLD